MLIIKDATGTQTDRLDLLDVYLFLGYTIQSYGFDVITVQKGKA